MKGCFNVGRWILGVVLAIFLFILLFPGVYLISISSVITNRSNAKNWVKEAGIYKNPTQVIVDVLGNLPEQPVESETSEQGEMSNAMLKEISTRLKNPNDELTIFLKSNLTPTFLENSVNQVLGAFYNWAEGETSQPRFTIQLIDSRKEFKNFLRIFIIARVKNLPSCPPEFQPDASFNPMEATCWPNGMSYEVLEQNFDQIEGQPEFEEMYQKATITGDQLDIPPNVSQQVQQVFKLLKSAPLVIIGVLALILGLLILIIPNTKVGLIISGIVLLIPGFMSLISSFMQSRAIGLTDQRLGEELPNEVSTTVGPYINNFISAAFNDFSSKVMIYSGVLIGLGAILSVLGFVLKSKDQGNRNEAKIDSKLQ